MARSLSGDCRRAQHNVVPCRNQQEMFRRVHGYSRRQTPLLRCVLLDIGGWFPGTGRRVCRGVVHYPPRRCLRRAHLDDFRRLRRDGRCTRDDAIRCALLRCVYWS